MSEKNNGGPFHPVVHCGVNSGTGEATGYQTEANWTVRDEFAARAIQGLMADPENCPDDDESLDEWAAGNAESAYKVADAMLAERAK